MIETVIDYVQVIDLLFRVAQFGAPRVRRLVMEARAGIEDGTETAEEVKEWLEEYLRRRIGRQQATRVMEDVEILGEFCSGLSSSWEIRRHISAMREPKPRRSKANWIGVVPKYGTMVHQLIEHTGERLEAMGCYETWGEKKVCDRGQGFGGSWDIETWHYLPMPRMGTAIRRTGLLAGQRPNWVVRRARAYLCRREQRGGLRREGVFHELYLRKLTVSRMERWGAVCRAAVKRARRSVLLEECTAEYWVERRRVDLELDFYERGYWLSGMERRVGQNRWELPLSYREFQPILLSALLDYLSYARRVLKEVAEGQGVREFVSMLGKAER